MGGGCEARLTHRGDITEVRSTGGVVQDFKREFAEGFEGLATAFE